MDEFLNPDSCPSVIPLDQLGHLLDVAIPTMLKTLGSYREPTSATAEHLEAFYNARIEAVATAIIAPMFDPGKEHSERVEVGVAPPIYLDSGKEHSERVEVGVPPQISLNGQQENIPEEENVCP